MAKGDDSRARNKIDYEGDRGKQLGENLRTGVLEPSVRLFGGAAEQAIPQQMADYGRLQSGYNEFAQTGGFSPEDKSSIRSRALSPIRSIYSGAMRDVDRQKSLQGGYSPGYGVLRGRMAREMSSGMSDATTNAEAAIAQMVQEGRLQGLSGGSSLYSASPGMAGTFGNQLLGATGQLSEGVGREMGFGQRIADQTIAASQIPGKWENTMGRIGDVANIAGRIGGAMTPFLGGGGMGGAMAPGAGITPGSPGPPQYFGLPTGQNSRQLHSIRPSFS